MSTKNTTYEEILSDPHRLRDVEYFRNLAEQGMAPQLRKLGQVLKAMDETRQYAQDSASAAEQLRKGNNVEAERILAERQGKIPCNHQDMMMLDYRVHSALNSMHMAIQEQGETREFHQRMADTHLQAALDYMINMQE